MDESRTPVRGVSVPVPAPRGIEMGMRQCAVCTAMVPEGYERDHLRANHFGPHRFWFGAVEYITDEPSMLARDILMKYYGTIPVLGFLSEDRNGQFICFDHGHAVDLTHEPHLCYVPPATWSPLGRADH